MENDLAVLDRLMWNKEYQHSQGLRSTFLSGGATDDSESIRKLGGLRAMLPWVKNSNLIP